MKEEYKRIVNEVKCTDNKLLNASISFLIGGLIGLVSQIIFHYLSLNMDEKTSYTIIFIIWVSIGSILTGFGVFDKLSTIFKSGLIVPSTGFSHAMTSSAMDNNKEGYIPGIGMNMFKLTGSIILYGIVFSILFAFIKGVFL